MIPDIEKLERVLERVESGMATDDAVAGIVACSTFHVHLKRAPDLLERYKSLTKGRVNQQCIGPDVLNKVLSRMESGMSAHAACAGIMSRTAIASVLRRNPLLRPRFDAAKGARETAHRTLSRPMFYKAIARIESGMSVKTATAGLMNRSTFTRMMEWYPDIKERYDIVCKKRMADRKCRESELVKARKYYHAHQGILTSRKRRRLAWQVLYSKVLDRARVTRRPIRIVAQEMGLAGDPDDNGKFPEDAWRWQGVKYEDEDTEACRHVWAKVTMPHSSILLFMCTKCGGTPTSTDVIICKD